MNHNDELDARGPRSAPLLSEGRRQTCPPSSACSCAAPGLPYRVGARRPGPTIVALDARPPSHRRRHRSVRVEPIDFLNSQDHLVSKGIDLVVAIAGGSGGGREPQALIRTHHKSHIMLIMSLIQQSRRQGNIAVYSSKRSINLGG